MDTTQKAPIIVTQGGQPVTGFSAVVDNGNIATIDVFNDEKFLVALAPGNGILAVSKNGQTGETTFTVTTAPLQVTLGPAVPK